MQPTAQAVARKWENAEPRSGERTNHMDPGREF